MKPSRPKMLLIAGRTGGPFFPFHSIMESLDKFDPVIVGVKGGFEEHSAKKHNLPIHFLPEVKLAILSFKKQKPAELIRNLLSLLILSLKLAKSILQSTFLLIRLRPKLVVSTGSFLSVPVVFAMRITNFFRLTSCVLWLHQQDPLPGLANRLCVKQAKFLSCVFEYTKQNFSYFSKAEVIPNPIYGPSYKISKAQALVKINNLEPKLGEFLSSKIKKPILLVFGGGSGSEDVNTWVSKNFKQILQDFKVVHLTGILQAKNVDLKHADYFSTSSLFEAMVPMLIFSDLVVCRAGLGSITELSFLAKPAFLAPLPHSHQELNAELVKSNFPVLLQKEQGLWLAKIKANYPLFFAKAKHISMEEIETKLQQFYDKLKDL